MKSGLHPIPVHGKTRNILFPLYCTKHFVIFAILALLCCIFGFLMKDFVATLTTLMILYLGFWLTLSRDIPYKLKIDPSDIPLIEQILDKAPFFKREWPDLYWRRKGVLATNQDSIKIVSHDGATELFARKRDVLGIQRLLNRAEGSPQLR